MPILRGTKVMLRPYRREDQEHILSWVNDKDVVRYLTHLFDMPYTEENARVYIDRVLEGPADRAAFVIAEAGTGDYLGQIDLNSINNRDRKAVLGIAIAAEKDRGRGVGREAIRLLCRYGFMTLGLNRVELTVHADNERARRCYRACGFREEGVQRQAIWRDGCFWDEVLMAILREDFDETEVSAQ